jgi:hypothetical protein
MSFRVGRISLALLAYVARLQRLSLVWGCVKLGLIRRFVIMLEVIHLSKLQGSSHALKLVISEGLDLMKCWLDSDEQGCLTRLPWHGCGLSFNFELPPSGESELSSQCIGGSSVC